jgi:5-methylcytosine-specific restriction endonuclease McrA
MTQDLRTCTKCNKRKPVSQYYVSKSRRDGLDAKCSQCARDYAAAWRSANPTKKKATSRAWWESNREKGLAANKAWQQANKEKKNTSTRNRLARLRGAPGVHSGADVVARFAVFGDKCRNCHTKENLCVDHNIPLIRGGANWPSNLMPLCRSCNSAKGRLTWGEFTSC